MVVRSNKGQRGIDGIVDRERQDNGTVKTSKLAMVSYLKVTKIVWHNRKRCSAV